MALWLVRAGSLGQYEKRFLDENRIYATWSGLTHDLSELKAKYDLYELLQKLHPDAKLGKMRNWTGQIWPFAKIMESGDWVVLPSKMKAAVHVGEIIGPYVFAPEAEDPFYHSREIKWIETDIPRSNFDQDLLYSFGALMTICSIKRNDAENRVRAMSKSGWKSEGIEVTSKLALEDEKEDEFSEDTLDLELLARDNIAKTIIRKFKGHRMALLVEEILKAQDYTTFRSPEGPDKGVDILAAPGPLGFGRPRIVVQVKSGDSPVDRPTLDQLIGTMQNVQADQGLLVSWGGFKSSIDKETAHHFFRVRLWDQDALIDQLLAQYNSLDEDLCTELPLKRIWTVAVPEEET